MGSRAALVLKLCSLRPLNVRLLAFAADTDAAADERTATYTPGRASHTVTGRLRPHSHSPTSNRAIACLSR